ncbi:GNAT family N-acetyltransferase [Nonomuraea sp. NPDC059194]|uniref:GNAT family N-acetyltransferase n=1 Tax=Nonomuraea sp. NPDC059194 TaxID=3346764 RepID=UPI0036B44548
MKIRKGEPGDVEAVLAMFDSAIEWLVSQGRTGQWGSEPFSASAKRVELVNGWAGGEGMRIAEIDGHPAGCMTLGEPLSYVAAAPEPEVYVQGLVIDQRFHGRSVGRALLERAMAEAAEQGVDLVRVDCYAGDDGQLVRYYESCGFRRTEEFQVGEWPGQVLERRVSAGSAA